MTDTANDARGESGPWVQVSRLGNPLFNEVIVPLGKKDRWNGTHPVGDWAFAPVRRASGAGQAAPGALSGGVPQPRRPDGGAGRPRRDPAHRPAGRHHPGVPELHRQDAGRHAAPERGHPARASPNALGILGGDLAGFPNGRRVADDVVTIELRAIAGVTYPLVNPSFKPDGAASVVSENLNPGAGRYQASFPYLGTPHDGFDTPSRVVASDSTPGGRRCGRRADPQKWRSHDRALFTPSAPRAGRARDRRRSWVPSSCTRTPICTAPRSRSAARGTTITAPHKDVLNRPVDGRPTYAAVFDRFADGSYTLWASGVAGRDRRRHRRRLHHRARLARRRPLDPAARGRPRTLSAADRGLIHVAALRFTRGLSRDEWLRLSGFGVAVAALHVMGWALFLYYSGQLPPPGRAGADGVSVRAAARVRRRSHRRDRQYDPQAPARGRQADGSGLLLLARPLDHRPLARRRPGTRQPARRLADPGIPALRRYVGAGVSGTFLWIIGILNLLVLSTFCGSSARCAAATTTARDSRIACSSAGMMSRFFGRFFRLIGASWQMYPLGFLFGLGFDTATEVGLLALAAGVATHSRALLRHPLAADPLRGGHEPDGHAGRRLHDPGVRLGVLQPDPQGLLQHHRHQHSRSWSRWRSAPSSCCRWCRLRLALSGGFWDWLNSLDFETLGYAMVGCSSSCGRHRSRSGS